MVDPGSKSPRKSADSPPLEPYWLKKMKPLDSYGFTTGVCLRFERQNGE